MSLLLGFLVLIGAILLFNRFFSFLPWTNQEWLALPTQQEYRRLHPQMCDGEATRCAKCGGTQQVDMPLLNPGVRHRKAMCVSCKTMLWRETFD